MGAYGAEVKRKSPHDGGGGSRIMRGAKGTEDVPLAPARPPQCPAGWNAFAYTQSPTFVPVATPMSASNCQCTPI